MQNLPRKIDPSWIQEGDVIIVRWPRDRGVLAAMEGRVHELRLGNGGLTHYITKEGGELLQWKVGHRSGVSVMLLSREPVKQEPLFDLGNIRERIK
jgi:hypothetical protein